MAAPLKVSVKWNKNKYDNVELDTTQPPLVFKMQLFSLTSVPPDRQKVMIKGGMLKDDQDWATVKDLKDGYTFMLMGTAEELPQAPVKATVFIEDMNESELAAATDTPPGLENLGNTCYMNATLQTLRAIPELKDALTKYPGTLSGLTTDPSHSMTVALRDLFGMLKNTNSVNPMIFLQVLRTIHPQFAQQTQGHFSQQDAEECYGHIVTALKQKLKVADGPSFVDQFFSIKVVSKWKCNEAPDEPETTTEETLTELKCHITKDVNLLFQGLEEGLKEQLDKMSPTLGRSAVYTKTSRLSQLPSYLTVNFVRFFWRRDTQMKAKILRKVKFPVSLDLSSFCTDELKASLAPLRERFKKYDDEQAEKRSKEKRRKQDTDAMDATPATADASSAVAVASSSAAPASASSAIAALSDGAGTVVTGKNMSGLYELAAVLTHIGRSSDSGHYMAWVRDSKDADKWWKFDDDKVSSVNTEEVLKLDGGGDWHMAYLCLYKERTLPSGA